MATLPKDRMYALGGAKQGQGPDRLVYFPVAASQTGNPGYLGTLASGVVTLTAAVAAGDVCGILEENIDTAKATNSLIAMTLVLPGRLYTASVNGTTSQAALVGAMRETELDPDISTAVLKAAEDTALGIRVIAAMGEQIATFETHGFLGKNDTAETAGVLHKPYEANFGAYDDTNPRVLCVFPEDFTAWD